MHTWVPSLLALCAALMIAGGTVLRQRASTRTGAITGGWWTGAVIALSGFALQAAALALGSLLLVQPLVLLAVLFALPMEAWMDKRQPLRFEWMWGVLLTASVVVFIFVAHPHSSDRRPDHPLIVGTIIVILAVLALLVVFAERSSTHYRALCYGLAAGTLFGVSALLVKTVVDQMMHSPVRVLTRPEVYLFCVVVVAAIMAQQRGFGAGELQTSFPAMTVIELEVSMVLGVVLLGETVTIGWWHTTLMLIALIVMVRSVIVLAKLAAMRGVAGASDATSVSSKT